jgi:hypothetical protein
MMAEKMERRKGEWVEGEGDIYMIGNRQQRQEVGRVG